MILIFHNATGPAAATPKDAGYWIRMSEPTYMKNKPRLQLYFWL